MCDDGLEVCLNIENCDAGTNIGSASRVAGNYYFFLLPNAPRI